MPSLGMGGSRRTGGLGGAPARAGRGRNSVSVVQPQPATRSSQPITRGSAPISRDVPVRPPTSSAPTAPTASTATSPNLTATAAADPRLEGLADRYTKYLDELGSGTGQVADTIAQKRRDAREGGRRSLQASSAFMGRASDPSIAGFEAETQRQVQGALTDVSLAERAMEGGAIRGGLGIAGAPGEATRAERGLGLSASREARAGQTDAWGREMDRVNREAADSAQAFNQWLALLEANRSSPIHSGWAEMG